MYIKTRTCCEQVSILPSAFLKITAFCLLPSLLKKLCVLPSFLEYRVGAGKGKLLIQWEVELVVVLVRARFDDQTALRTFSFRTNVFYRRTFLKSDMRTFFYRQKTFSRTTFWQNRFQRFYVASRTFSAFEKSTKRHVNVIKKH